MRKHLLICVVFLILVKTALFAIAYPVYTAFSLQNMGLTFLDLKKNL